MASRTTTKETPDEQQSRRDSVIDDLLADSADPDEVIAHLRARAETRNRAAQATLPLPPSQADADFEARRAWLLDGQPIYGELKTFYFPALAALQADDQIAFSRQRDLLFKALRTIFGDPPPEAPAIQP